MPMEMRQLGDAYLRSEFKLHKAVTNEAQLDSFFTAWEDYRDQMLMTARRRDSISMGGFDSTSGMDVQDSGFGQALPSDTELSEEQISQLEKLREEATRPK